MGTISDVYSPGQAFAPGARQVNAWNLAARMARRAKTGSEKPKRATDYILIENEIADDIDQFDLVGLGDVRIDPTDNEAEFLRSEIYEAEEYDARVHGMDRLAIVLEPVAQSSTKLVRAVSSGHVQVKITINDATHDFAIPRHGEAQMSSSTDGFPIIYKESGTGADKWAIVDLSHGWHEWFVGKASEAIAANTIFCMNGINTESVGGVNYYSAKSGYEITDFGDYPFPPGACAVSPGFALTSGQYFLFRENWPAWVKTASAATEGGTVGVDQDANGEATPWIPGWRVIDAESTRALIVPDTEYMVGALTGDPSYGIATAELVEVDGGEGTKKGASFNVMTYDTVAT